MIIGFLKMVIVLKFNNLNWEILTMWLKKNSKFGNFFPLKERIL